MELTKLTKADIKAHLQPAADHDFSKEPWHVKSLDPDRSWFRVDCPEGHTHVIEWDGKTATVFECDESGVKYAITPDDQEK